MSARRTASSSDPGSAPWPLSEPSAMRPLDDGWRPGARTAQDRDKHSHCLCGAGPFQTATWRSMPDVRLARMLL